MASKYRPKGKLSDLLKMDASQISKLTAKELQGVVAKLQDAANKRIQRLKSSGFGEFSHSDILREGRKFKLPHKTLSKADARIEYSRVKSFLESRSNTIEGITEKFLEVASKVKTIDLENIYDKRYKKKKVIKESARKEVSKFWQKYHEWKEIEADEYPDMAKEYRKEVEEFYEEVYSKGKAYTRYMRSRWKKAYKASEAKRREKERGNNQISTSPANRQGKGKTKSSKFTKTKYTAGIGERFEVLSPLDYGDGEE